MIHPSYVELMKVVNQNAVIGEEPVVNSRYSIVCATAKRAREIVDGSEPMVENAAGKKALSIAVEELNNGSLKILTDAEVDEKNQELKQLEEDLASNNYDFSQTDEESEVEE